LLAVGHQVPGTGEAVTETRHAPPGFGRLLAVVAGFVVIGMPLVALAWHNLNHLLSGDLRLAPALIFLGAAGGLVAVLIWLARLVSEWDRA
jgi:hypothetical protein